MHHVALMWCTMATCLRTTSQISDLSSRDRKVDLLRSATRDSGCDKPQISDLSSRDRKVAYLRFEPVILGAINLKSQISNLGTEVRP